MILSETYTLENGLSIPKLGLGTWFIDDGQAAEAVRTAVKLGYRLIDTAQAYGTERGVGEGVRTCGVPREELFVASKVAAELKTYDEAKKSIDETLEKMGLDYLDQMIIHSPQPWNQFRVEKRYSEENKAVWRALEDAQSEGKVRVIGVSNFLRDDLENLLSDCRVKPMVNQILLHISNTDLALLDYCREQGIQVEAYSPIAHGEALKNPATAEMGKKYGVNAAQLCIRYVIELGAVALPKTANPAHMASNAQVDFEISEADMETLRRMEGLVQVYMPDFKYADPALAKRYSSAPDYPEVAAAAIAEMFRQAGPYELDDEGLLQKGMLVRHLILPEHPKNSRGVMDTLTRLLPKGSFLFSLMSQYTPMPGLEDFPELTKTVTPALSDFCYRYMLRCGIEDGYYQDLAAATDEMIPEFDLTGVDGNTIKN